MLSFLVVTDVGIVSVIFWNCDTLIQYFYAMYDKLKAAYSVFRKSENHNKSVAIGIKSNFTS